MKHIIRSTAGTLLAGMIAAGCATSPPASDVAAATTAISNAGQAIDQAAANPHVASYATSELARATGSLDKAKAAWSDKHDVRAAMHYAYIAQQRATTAQELANGRASEDVVKLAAAQRDQVVSVAAAQRRARPAVEEVQHGIPGFAVGAAKLPAASVQMMDALANTLKDGPERMVVIEGHTDNVGSPVDNQALALERAEAVRTALILRGVDTSRITIRSHGEGAPAASNDTGAGRRENRRAQVIIADMETSMVGSSRGSGATTSSGGPARQGGQRGQRR